MIGAFASSSFSAEFHDEIVRDYTVKTLGQLQIANLRGGIVVQGWALDRIRVTAKRRAVAASAQEARKLFTALDFRYRNLGTGVELSAEYGKGLEIQDRLREREQPHTSMEMVVQAPSRMKLSVWAVDGVVSVKNWNESVDVRTSKGSVLIQDVNAKLVSLVCPDCQSVVRDARGGALRMMGGTESVEVESFEGEQVYIETSAGSQTLSHVSGEQLYVSKTGKIAGRNMKGRIEFQSQKGAVSFLDSSGFVSGRTESGDIQVRMREWRFFDKALIESSKGAVKLALPSQFSGEIDLWSVSGKTSTVFSVRNSKERGIYGPEPVNHIRGRVGDGGEQLKLFSQDGDVALDRYL